MRKVLIIGDCRGIFLRKLFDNLVVAGKKRYSFGLVSDGKRLYSSDQFDECSVPKKCIQRIFNAIYISKKISSEKPDVVHIHFLDPLNVFYKSLLKDAKVIITLWGSDLYRYPTRSLLKKLLQKFLIKRADIITVVSPKMKNDFQKIFGFEDKPILLTRFAIPIDLSIIDSLSEDKLRWFRRRFSVGENEIIITLGYSADPGKKHMYMIDEIVKLYNTFKNIFVFLPMTYGNVEHRELEQITKRYVLVLKVYTLLLV
ncbi:MAG: glycosyltransferase family 4 protein [Fervidobacterium gondwanense]|uniref:glycosyltransferase family 4 protein n=1 Tax=Fervidobacterium gondwanense TaxID=44754 RepID=UPI0009331C50|nr:glycosyltransferase [Fervidobacterium gondwanense]